MNFARRNSTLLLGPILSGLLLLNSCTTAPSRPKPAAKTNPIAQKEFQTAKANLKSGNPKRGLAQIRQFAQANPNSELTGEAHFILGQAAFDAQNYSEAFNQFNEATKHEHWLGKNGSTKHKNFLIKRRQLLGPIPDKTCLLNLRSLSMKFRRRTNITLKLCRPCSFWQINTPSQASVRATSNRLLKFLKIA
jgi:hypothetical protein